MKTANWRYRKQMAARVRKGSYVLRVVGNQKTGFHLVCQGCDCPGCLVVIGPVQGFKRQKDAVAYGKRKYRKTAKKLIGSI